MSEKICWILHAFIKNKNKTPIKDIQKALAIRDTIINAQKSQSNK